MRGSPLLALLLCVPAVAQSDVLYGVGMGGTVLVRLDTGTLVATPIGTIGFSQVGGLAVGNDLVLYGVEASGDQLIRIDVGTGAGTAIGPTGRALTFSTGAGNDPTTDQLYAVAQGGIGFSSVLVRLDKTTGTATAIGDMASASGSAIVGLDFDRTGQLWGIDGAGAMEHLIRVDKTTGAATIVGMNGLANHAGIGGFAIGQSGTFWAVNLRGSTAELVVINPATGAPIVVGNLSGSGISAGLTGLSADCWAFPSAEVARAGTPPNPNAFRPGTQGPVIGRTWNPTIDHTSFFPGALTDFMLLSPPSSMSVTTPFGTALCDLRVLVVVTKSSSVPFAIPIPHDCTLISARLCTQGGAIGGSRAGLANALDLVIGSY